MYTQSALEWYPVEGVWVFYICLSSEAICHPGHNVKTIRFSPVSLPQTGGGGTLQSSYQPRDGRYCPAIIIRQTLLPVTSTGMGDTHQLLHIRQTLLAVTSPGMGDSALLLLHDRFYSMLFPLKQFSKIIARKGHNTLCLINCIIIYSHIYTIPKII